MAAAMANSAEATATVPVLEALEVVTQAVATGERPIPRSETPTRKEKQFRTARIVLLAFRFNFANTRYFEHTLPFSYVLVLLLIPLSYV